MEGQPAGFSNEYDLNNEGHYDALVRMFEQGLKVSVTLAAEQRNLMLERCDGVRNISHNFGYGVGDDSAMIWMISWPGMARITKSQI